MRKPEIQCNPLRNTNLSGTGQATCRETSQEAVAVIQGTGCGVLDQCDGRGDGEEGKGKASYKVKLTNYTVLAFKKKTIFVEKIFSLLIHPSLT